MLNLKLSLWLALVALAVLAVNLLHLDRYPLSWIDEVMYTDPAYNLATGQGFVSSAWGSQSVEEFWASNTPLYSLLLGGWLALLGPEWMNVRGFSLLLGIATATALTIATRNFGWIRKTEYQVSFFLLVLTIFPIVYSYRIARPDILGLCLSSLLLYFFSLPAGRLRYVCVLLTAACLPATSLAVALFAAIQGAGAFLFFRKKVFVDVLVLGTGLGVGAAALAFFYLVNDALLRFSMITVGSGHTLLGQLGQFVVYGDTRALEKLSSIPGSYLAVLFYFPLTMTLVLAATIFCAVSFRMNRIQVCILTSAFLTPLLLLIAGKYTWHYNWMHFSILLIFIFSLSDQFAGTVRPVAWAWIAMLSALGLPWLTIHLATDWRTLSPSHLESFVEEHVDSDDVLVADPSIYYLARAKGASVFTPNYGGGRGLPEIPDHQRIAVTKIIVPEDLLERMAAKYGGSWQPTATFFMEPNSGFAGIRDGEFFELGRPSMTVYERATDKGN